MKKTLIIFLVALCLLSCKQEFDIEKYDITKIEVFYVPFGILTPTQSDEKSIRGIKSYLIEEDSAISNIKNQIKKLSKSESETFNKNSIYLLCDFYTKDNKAFTLMFDKNFIDINGKTYDDNESLIDMLIKKD